MSLTCFKYVTHCSESSFTISFVTKGKRLAKFLEVSSKDSVRNQCKLSFALLFLLINMHFLPSNNFDIVTFSSLIFDCTICRNDGNAFISFPTSVYTYTRKFNFVEFSELLELLVSFITGHT